MSFSLDQKVIFAARSQNMQLLQERHIAGGNLNYFDLTHGSAISSAINNHDETILRYLIVNGANVNAEYPTGVTPLELALHHSSNNIVRMLCEAGAKLTKKSRPHWKEKLETILNDY
jgi:ankyrin repeat protein